MAILCCKDCKVRTEGCHGKCKKYLSAKEQWEKEKVYIRKQNKNVIARNEFDDICYVGSKRYKKRIK